MTPSASQTRAIEMIERAIERREPGFLFITGEAGTGKSTVLRAVRSKKKLIVAAPTGLAAVNVRGETLHRAFRLPIGPITRARTRALNDEMTDILAACDAIAIDEISMVQVIAALAAPALSVTVSFLPSLQAEFIDWLDLNVRRIRVEPDRPFGGVQLVFAGGF
jgi:type II secretory pathway predicted ATPase ExeA